MEDVVTKVVIKKTSLFSITAGLYFVLKKLLRFIATITFLEDI